MIIYEMRMETQIRYNTPNKLQKTKEAAITIFLDFNIFTALYDILPFPLSLYSKCYSLKNVSEMLKNRHWKSTENQLARFRLLASEHSTIYPIGRSFKELKRISQFLIDRQIMYGAIG